MYKIYHLLIGRKIVGVAVARGMKVARFFQEYDQVDYDYYEEVGCVRYLWMLQALFEHRFPEIIEADAAIAKGMNLRVFLTHDGTQDSCQWTNDTDGQENQNYDVGEPDDSWLNDS